MSNQQQDNVHFNLEKEFESEVMPLIKALHDKCGEIGMPLFVAACILEDEKRQGIVQSIQFNGSRTPLQFRAAQAIVDDRVPKPIVHLVLATDNEE